MLHVFHYLRRSTVFRQSLLGSAMVFQIWPDMINIYRNIDLLVIFSIWHYQLLYCLVCERNSMQEAVALRSCRVFRMLPWVRIVLMARCVFCILAVFPGFPLANRLVKKSFWQESHRSIWCFNIFFGKHLYSRGSTYSLGEEWCGDAPIPFWTGGSRIFKHKHFLEH